MPLPPKLTKFTTASPIVASFDFVDIAEGTGTFVFFGTIAEETGGQSQLLVRNQDDSVITSIAGGPFNFDTLKFNLPRTIKGTGYIAGYFVGTGTASTVTVKIQKWDGSSATDVSSAIVSQDGSSGTQVLYIKIPLTTTHIAIGEQIRLVITLGTNARIGTSPTGQSDGSMTSTTLKLGISFDLEL